MLVPFSIFFLTFTIDISNQIGNADYFSETISETAFSHSDEDSRFYGPTSFDNDISSWRREGEDSLTLRALKRAIRWTMQRRNPDYGWGSDTPHTVLALSLADSFWFHAKNLESQLVLKQFEIHLLLRMFKNKESPMTSGQIALNAMTIVSLCKNPRSFYGKDLVALLEHHENRMDFEMAFSYLASCNAGRRLKRSKIRRLLVMISHKPEIHSVDTLSVVILALHCAQKQRRLELRTYVNEAIGILLTHQEVDGSFASNLHSTSIALQALTSSGLSATWNVTQAQQYVMSHQLLDGSFGNLFETNAVLPILAGKTLLDVGRKVCHEESSDIDEVRMDFEVDHLLDSPASTTIMPDITEAVKNLQIEQKLTIEEKINVTYIIWIGAKASLHYNMSLLVPKNTTFYQIMKIAAEKDQHYEFSASKWTSGYYVHTISGKHEKQDGFWFWLLYRMPELPVPGTKPDSKYILGQGVAELLPKDGDILLFWYHKL